jgi:AcrR family transcriptional regulator
MRITANQKELTRERILAAAVDLFRRQGFDTTTTRDIAQGAGIASGTLFNYFDTKEAIVASLAVEALAKAHSALDGHLDDASLEESLFDLTAAELRQLKPLRKFIRPVLETFLSPLAAFAGRDPHGLRVEHLEVVASIAHRHGIPIFSSVRLQVYWALYTGVLAFWATDKSPKQEDTLALLDESLAMFVAWLKESTTV